MRILNIVGALNGACALIVLAAAMHLGRASISEHMFGAMQMAGYLQLGGGAACLALANRNDRVSLVAGAMIGAGAAIFAAAIDLGAVTNNQALLFGAPVGGLLMIFGWLGVAFATPKT